MKLNQLQRTRMMKNMLFRPLRDLVNLVGYTNISKQEKQDYQTLSHQLKKLDKKIEVLIKNKYHLTY